MKQPDDYDFVKLSRKHLDILVSWADQDGWIPSPWKESMASPCLNWDDRLTTH
jgi:hypothetical protein